MSSIRGRTESGLNDYITKDLEKYEAEIRQLKIIYEEGSRPPNTTLLCKALKSYIDHLEKSKVNVSNRLGVAKPQFALLNNEIQSIEAEIGRVCVSNITYNSTLTHIGLTVKDFFWVLILSLCVAEL